MAKKNELDEMLMFNPGYLFRFRERKSSKFAMEKKHFILLMITVTIMMIVMRIMYLMGYINFT